MYQGFLGERQRRTGAAQRACVELAGYVFVRAQSCPGSGSGTDDVIMSMGTSESYPNVASAFQPREDIVGRNTRPTFIHMWLSQCGSLVLARRLQTRVLPRLSEIDALPVCPLSVRRSNE